MSAVDEDLASSAEVADLKSAADDVLSVTADRYHPCQLLHALPKRFECHKSREAAKAATTKLYKDICRSELFLRLRAEDIIEVIQRDDINIEHEDLVVHSVFTWFEYDWEGRKVFLDDVIQYLRLPFCTDDYLHCVVAEHPCMINGQGRKYVEEAMKYKSCEVHQHEFCTPRTMPRNHFDVKRLLVFCPTDSALGDPFSKPRHVKHEQEYPWLPLIDTFHPQHQNNKQYSVCLTQRGLLFTGGINTKLDKPSSLQTCWLLDIQQKIWKDFPSMAEPRYNHTSVYHLGDIYVLGGSIEWNPTRKTNSVEIYKAGLTMRQQSTPLPQAAVGTSYAVSNGKYIYVFTRRTVVAYHPSRHKWECRTEIPVRFNGEPVSYSDCIFVPGYNLADLHFFAVAKYDTINNTWTVLSPPPPLNTPITYSSFQPIASVVWKDRILLAGNRGGIILNKKSTILYNPQTNTLTSLNINLASPSKRFKLINIKI